MDIDLSRALHDAADRTTAARPAMSTAPVLRRIRRRRTVVRATAGTVGVAAAGAVAVGGAALTEALRTEPAPPAVTTPTPTPTPSTTPSADAPWPAVTLVGEPACGQPMPAVDDPAGPGDLRHGPGPRRGPTRRRRPSSPGSSSPWTAPSSTASRARWMPGRVRTGGRSG